MSTLKGKEIIDVPNRSPENRETKPITNYKIVKGMEPEVFTTKGAKKQRKSILGPCDTFDYDFKTNQLWYNLIVPVVSFAMKFGWRIKVEGKNNVPKKGNYVLMPNHISHMDAFLAGVLLAPRSAPNAIGDEKLFKNKFFRIFAEHLNGFPVRKGAKNMNIVNYAASRINSGSSMLWFPEGKRHKKPWINKCSQGKLGSGMLAHLVKAPIIPAYIGGAEFAMPVGKRITWGRGPRSLQLTLKYGKPVPLDDLRKLPQSPETSKLIVDRIIQKIEELRPKSPYRIQKTKQKQTYKQAKKRLFESQKYDKDYLIMK